MIHDHMHVLNNLHVIDIHMNTSLGDMLQPAAAISQQAESLRVVRVGILNGLDHIHRVAAAGDADDKIAGA